MRKQSERSRGSPWSLVAGWGAAFLVVLASYRPAPLWLHVICLTVSVAAGIALHELSHAAVSAILGLRVVAIEIGVGPAIAEVSVARSRVAIRAVPIGGHVRILLWSRRLARLRLALTYAAGPLANALLAAVAIAVAQLSTSEVGPIATGGAILHHELMTFGVANLVMSATNLWPVKTPRMAAKGAQGSDGYGIVTAFWLADDTIQAMIDKSAGPPRSAGRSTPRRDLPN